MGSTMPNQYQKKEKTSQYKGVSWHKQSGKWLVRVPVKGEKLKYGGTFKDEMDAAKRVNQLCEELKIPSQNAEITQISKIPNQQYRQKKKEKTSEYKGVCWDKQNKKWRVWLTLKGGESKYGGMFKDQQDAAERINQLCEEFGIPIKNSGIVERPSQQSPLDDYQIPANSVIDSENLKTDNDDDANIKKRKR